MVQIVTLGPLEILIILIVIIVIGAIAFKVLYNLFWPRKK